MFHCHVAPNSPHNVALVHPSIEALSAVIPGLAPDATELTSDQEKEARKIIAHELEASLKRVTGFRFVAGFHFVS